MKKNNEMSLMYHKYTKQAKNKGAGINAAFNNNSIPHFTSVRCRKA